MAGPLAGCLGTPRQAVTQPGNRPAPSLPDRVIQVRVQALSTPPAPRFRPRRRPSQSARRSPGQSLPVLLLIDQPRSCFHPGRTLRLRR
jgi:hypothetical protein